MNSRCGRFFGAYATSVTTVRRRPGLDMNTLVILAGWEISFFECDPVDVRCNVELTISLGSLVNMFT
jgi:hypothetical protein